MKKSFLAGTLAVIIAYMLQARFGGAFESAVLATLLSFAFALEAAEIGLLGIFAAWFLNWQPSLSPEITLLVLLPALVSIVKHIVPSAFLVGYFSAAVLGVGVWYAVADAQFIGVAVPALVREVGTGFFWALIWSMPIRMLARETQ
jgi:hypothetical protein